MTRNLINLRPIDGNIKTIFVSKIDLVRFPYAESVSREAACFSIFRETDPLRSFAVGITTKVYTFLPIFSIQTWKKGGKERKRKERRKREKDEFNSWKNSASPIVIARTSWRYVSTFKTAWNIFSE